jgi:hypothetical protein
MPGKERRIMADLRIVTLTGAAAALGEGIVEQFGSRLRGELLHPGTIGYEEARLIWNGLKVGHRRYRHRRGGSSPLLPQANRLIRLSQLSAKEGGCDLQPTL